MPYVSGALFVRTSAQRTQAMLLEQRKGGCAQDGRLQQPIVQEVADDSEAFLLGSVGKSGLECAIEFSRHETSTEGHPLQGVQDGAEESARRLPKRDEVCD